MAANTRLAVALHLLAALAKAGRTLTSEDLAGSVNTNAVVLRTILARLAKARIVEAQAGRAGGFRLARPVEEITVLEVWRAVDAEGIFTVHGHPVCEACPVSTRIKDVLGEVFADAEAAVARSFGRTSLADVVARFDGPKPGRTTARPDRGMKRRSPK